MLSQFWQEFRSAPQLRWLVLIIVGVPLAFYGTTATMARVWIENETFTHGFLIMPISLWLIWQRRDQLREVPLIKDIRAVALLLPVLALWLLAKLVGVAAVEQLAMVALIPICVWLLLGHRFVLATLFPLLYLFFSVPLGQSLIPPMMEFTADFTVSMVQRSGVPIFRDGLSFELPSGSWSVVEECSGVRYLIASAALGTIYAYITYRSYTRRTIFIVVSLLVPILANGLRAYGIVMIGHLSGMKYAVGVDHLLYGWVFFGVVIFALFWIGGFWAEEPPSSKTASDGGATKKTEPSIGRAFMLFAAFLAVSVGTQAITSTEVRLPPGTSYSLPNDAGLWRKTRANKDPADWSPALHNPDLVASATYTRADESVTVDLGYFHAQRDGAEAISSLNRVTSPYDGNWKLIASKKYRSPVTEVIESEVTYGNRKVLVWSFYIVGQSLEENPYRAKVLQAIALLQGERHAAYINLSTSYDDEQSALRERLTDALSSLKDPIRDGVLLLAATGGHDH